MGQRTLDTLNITSFNGFSLRQLNKWRSLPGGQMKIKVAEHIAVLLNSYRLKREITTQMAHNKIMYIKGQM